MYNSNPNPNYTDIGRYQKNRPQSEYKIKDYLNQT